METKPYEIVDAFWKNWSHSLSLFSSAGKQLEQLTLETLKQQQDALHKLTAGADELEKELQQFTAQLNSQYTEYVKQFTGNALNEQINEWQGKWNELSNHIHQLTVSPTKTSLSILTQTSGQFEETTKQFIEQQQLQRDEVQKQLESFLEEFKSTQLELAKKFEENSKNLFTSIK
ncbi:polyhydroxyalkanoic acid inclusion protein PhaP [Bacillus gaemokensis]|uniref:DNA recombinase n=1 Tax=Bacillus gaemokensis TaxID=574375 RepID=A0A073KAJ2_9BACI|nr:polyhydroxyalkanoic acid inclusion protein PhaP [Bacillus gaemokensis]KEK23585.1 DNA recombinase [Bacillus gaemokensis]KYG26380.1 DNA recombinase [Bacillus gaemokensis]